MFLLTKPDKDLLNKLSEFILYKILDIPVSQTVKRRKFQHLIHQLATDFLNCDRPLETISAHLKKQLRKTIKIHCKECSDQIFSLNRLVQIESFPIWWCAKCDEFKTDKEITMIYVDPYIETSKLSSQDVDTKEEEHQSDSGMVDGTWEDKTSY